MPCSGAGSNNVTESFSFAEGWPTPPVTPGYSDIRNIPPGHWQDFIGARICRRYDTGGVDSNGRARWEATADNVVTAKGLQDTLLVNPTIPGAPGGSLTLTQEVRMRMVQGSPSYQGPFARLYKASGGVYSAATVSVGVRWFQRSGVHNLYLNYNGGVTILSKEVTPLPADWFKLTFEVVNIGTFFPAEPERGGYDLRVYVNDTLELEQLNWVAGTTWARPGGEPQNMLYASMNAYGIEEFDQFKITIPGAGGVTPFASPGSIVPQPLPEVLPTYFMMNWQGGSVVNTNYEVDITKARTLAESRRILSGRPVRTISLNHVGIGEQETYTLMMRLMRTGYQNMPVPLFSDHSRVTSSSSGTTINCDTRYRRFFENGRIVIHSWAKNEGAVRPSNIEYAEIDSLTDSQITTKEALSFTHLEGARVIPVMDTELLLTGDMAGLTDSSGVLQLTALEIPGQSALLPTENEVPSEFPLADDGYPIVNLGAEYGEGMRWGMLRQGKKIQQGRAEIIAVEGDRPQFIYTLPFLGLRRETVWPIIKLFDSRRGRGKPFYFVSPQAAFKSVAISTANIDIEPWGDFEDLQLFLTYVAIQLYDGTIYLRAEDGLADAGSFYRITFDSAIPAITLDQIKRVSLAQFVRFEQNGMQENWATDETCSILLTLIELLEEKAVTLECPS